MDTDLLFSIIDAMGSIATAGALIFAFWQIREARLQATTSFEDALDREYRDIVHHIPIAAFMGEKLTPEAFEKALPFLYRYIDLSNQQVFLRQKGRIKKDTWIFWRDGIQSNLKRYPFNVAWERIKEHSQESFSELKRLENSEFSEDPRKWRKLE
jgi:hypothetical protein